MNIKEYTTIKDLNYTQYCDYLQKKYGICPHDYFTKTWNRNKKCTRTAEGLVSHHKFEDHAQKLCDRAEAMKYPFEWQTAENLVFCDYLEHLLLHILICESDFENALDGELVGVGGMLEYIIPELNDVYSGWNTNQAWRANCHAKIINDEDVYLTLIKRFKTNCSSYPFCNDMFLMTSYNKQFGLWDGNNNKYIFDKILKL